MSDRAARPRVCRRAAVSKLRLGRASNAFHHKHAACTIADFQPTVGDHRDDPCVRPRCAVSQEAPLEAVQSTDLLTL